MAKEQQAPGDLERVRAFVNTADLEAGGDALTSAASLASWLSEQDLASPAARCGTADLKRALALREALRTILLSHSGDCADLDQAIRTLDDIAARAKLRLRFDSHGDTVLEPQAPGVDGALGRLLAIVHEAIARGTWSRLKACRDPACAWAFYDHTKNRSGTWCDMQVCGNRAKARAYRQRHARATA
jgi:predicted RNA-binding Zn ribbon-like protein